MLGKDYPLADQATFFRCFKFCHPVLFTNNNQYFQLEIINTVLLSYTSSLRTTHHITGLTNLLSTGSDFIYVVKFVIGNLVLSLGSENNSLYVYYKGVSKQLLTFKFDASRGVLVKQLLFPAWVHLIKFNKRSRVNNKYTRRTSMTLLWCLFCELWTYFKHCSVVSIFDFEQENSDLVVSKFYVINYFVIFYLAVTFLSARFW